MLRSILFASVAAYIAVSSAAPVLAPDSLDARVAELEAKLKALDAEKKVEAKSVVKEGRGGLAYGSKSHSFTLSSGGGGGAGGGKLKALDTDKKIKAKSFVKEHGRASFLTTNGAFTLSSGGGNVGGGGG